METRNALIRVIGWIVLLLVTLLILLYLYFFSQHFIHLSCFHYGSGFYVQEQHKSVQYTIIFISSNLLHCTNILPQKNAMLNSQDTAHDIDT